MTKTLASLRVRKGNPLGPLRNPVARVNGKWWLKGFHPPEPEVAASRNFR